MPDIRVTVPWWGSWEVGLNGGAQGASLPWCPHRGELGEPEMPTGRPAPWGACLIVQVRNKATRTWQMFLTQSQRLLT